MKNKALVFFLVLSIAIPVFSQEPGVPIRVEVSFAEKPEPQNAVFFDFGPMLVGAILGGFGIGVGYERAIADEFTLLGHFNYIGAELEFSNDKMTFLLVGGSIAGRYYPLKTAVRGLFIEMGAGFNYTNFAYYIDKYLDEELKSLVVELGPTVGWKFISRRGIFMELGVGCFLRLGKGPFERAFEEAGMDSGANYLRWLFSLGWTF